MLATTTLSVFVLLYLPCKYGNSLHMSSPNTKSRNNVPISVNGMHSTPSKMSDTAKFSRNTFVIVRIRRFCISVKITSELPTMANNRMVAYSGIWMQPVDSHDAAATLVLLPEPNFIRLLFNVASVSAVTVVFVPFESDAIPISGTPIKIAVRIECWLELALALVWFSFYFKYFSPSSCVLFVWLLWNHGTPSSWGWTAFIRLQVKVAAYSHISGFSLNGEILIATDANWNVADGIRGNFRLKPVQCTLKI